MGFAAAGLLLSVFLVRETHGHAALEALGHDAEKAQSAAPEGAAALAPERPSAGEVFWRTTLRDRNLSSVSQAGLVNNLNDGMAWGLFPLLFAGAVLLGLGTAMVYPTLLAAIGDVAHPSWRASSVGTYRLWRDLGYAIGALLAGATADALGLGAAIWLVAGLTFASGALVAGRMTETLQRPRRERLDPMPSSTQARNS